MLVPIKLDEVYEVKIEALENEGKGVCKINGMIVFVPKALPGETVRVRITEIKKNFARGKIVEILEASKNRIQPDCPFYDECGGCNLRHQSLDKNLQFKEEKVKNAIERIGKLNIKVDSIIPSFKNDNYRNKASFKVENNIIGFYAEGTYQLVDIEYCMLLDNTINKSLEKIRKYIKENDTQIKTVTIKHGNALDEILIDIYSTNEDDIRILDYLKENIKKLSTVVFNNKIIYGNGYIKQVSNGLMFNCSSKSFFQVNDVQTEVLYNTAIKLANLNKEDIVLDLYCGTGTISNIVAQHVKKVIGIEIVEDAIKDAKENSKINNINNTYFIQGDAAKKIINIEDSIDVLFIDPPRSGIERSAISIIKKLSPKRIIYVSCDPVTLSRDLSYLSDTYDTIKILPVDMFPNTAHVETVAVLKLIDK